MEDPGGNRPPLPHVFRITAEIAEYRRRVADVTRSDDREVCDKNMSRVNDDDDDEYSTTGSYDVTPESPNCNGSSAYESKTKREKNKPKICNGSNNIETNKQKTVRHSKDSTVKSELVSELRRTINMNNHNTHNQLSRSQSNAAPNEQNSRCGQTGKLARTVTFTGVPLRKPSLAKGFNVEKALRENPRLSHMEIPENGHHSSERQFIYGRVGPKRNAFERRLERCLI